MIPIRFLYLLFSLFELIFFNLRTMVFYYYRYDYWPVTRVLNECRRGSATLWNEMNWHEMDWVMIELDGDKYND